uniref:Uncharacterized protein n=1 Tax=Arundo donax TaxID=35708 RepID=A0A0A9ENG2_ARUDO
MLLSSCKNQILKRKRRYRMHSCILSHYSRQAAYL